MGHGITLYTLDRTGLVLFSGEEAQSFLHGQLSCDVASLGTDKSTYGSYCTPKGRVLASFLLWRSAQGFFMQLPAALREPIQKRLTMFILRSKVKSHDASGQFARIGLAGSGAAAATKRVFGDAPIDPQEVKHLDDVMLIRLPGDRVEIVVPSDKAARIQTALEQRAQKEDQDVWELRDIRAGIPWITPATQDEFVPQAVNLDLIGGVSFTKGCYPGQEIVARMHYRSQTKRRMYLANISADSAPQPGDRLFGADMSEAPCGMIVNAARAPEGGYDALASIQTSSVEAGEVHWKTRDGPHLRITPLPYELR